MATLAEVKKYLYQVKTEVDSSVNNVSLYTAEEDVTLIRTIINLTIWDKQVNSEHFVTIQYEIQPQGTGVATAPTLNEGNPYGANEPAPQDHIAHFFSGYRSVGNGTDTTMNFPVISQKWQEDIKTGRKLEQNDVLKLRMISGATDQFYVVGTIIMFIFEK